MKTNVGTIDRLIRIFAALGIFYAGYHYQNWWGLVGFAPLITAFVGFCPLYVPFKMSTCCCKGGSGDKGKGSGCCCR
jgi:hypothetical protein